MVKLFWRPVQLALARKPFSPRFRQNPQTALGRSPKLEAAPLQLVKGSQRMYTVQESGRRAGRDNVVVQSQGMLVGGGSLSFVHWMHKTVPIHKLRPEQVALVKWYEDWRIKRN